MCRRSHAVRPDAEDLLPLSLGNALSADLGRYMWPDLLLEKLSQAAPRFLGMQHLQAPFPLLQRDTHRPRLGLAGQRRYLSRELLRLGVLDVERHGGILAKWWNLLPATMPCRCPDRSLGHHWQD